jgi:hypothetical protein
MKEKIIIIGILILSLSTFGQSSKIEYGIKGGINFFNFRIEQPKEYLRTEINSKFNVGFFAGLFVNYNFNKNVKIQIEPNFQKKKTEISTSRNSGILYDDQDYDLKNIFSEYSLESPLIVRLTLNRKVSLEGGFNFVYILKERENRDIQFENYFESAERSRSINEFETGLIIGGLYNISNNIGLNLRYNHSLNQKDEELLNKRIINIGIEYKI